MFFERFTEKARTAVVLAQQQARERGDDTIDTWHLLRALFAALGIDLDEVRRRVEEAFGPGALDRVRRPRGRRWGGHIPFAKESKKTLELALREAIALGHNYIGTEHMLLAMLRGGGVAHDVLVARGVRLDAARVIVEELVRGRRAG